MYKVELDKAYFPAQGDTPPAPQTVGGILRASAAKWPDAYALRELDYEGEFARSWTYAEFHKDSERLSRALASRHAEGARVAVFANNIPEWLLLEFGCGLAGLTLVTVNPSFQPRELKYVLEQSRSEALYYVDGFRGNPIGDIAESVCAELPGIKHMIKLGDHEALFAGEDQPHAREPKPTDAAQIQYTSGTTGFPKGAVLHHFGLVQNGIDTLGRGGLKPGDVFITTWDRNGLALRNKRHT